MTSLLEQTLHISTAGSLLGAVTGGAGKTNIGSAANDAGNLPSVLLSIMNHDPSLFFVFFSQP